MTPQRILPDLQCALICDGVRQEANGNLMFLGVLDRVLAMQFPVNVPQVFIVTRWTAGKGTFHQTIKLLATDEITVLAQTDGKVQLNAPEVSATAVMPVGGFKFERPGPYWCEVILDDVLKLRFSLPVFQVTPPPNAPGTKAPPPPPS
jgi:hypothetical protein